MVETAVALTVVITAALWLFELCMLVYVCSVLSQAAHRGVQYAITHGADSANCSGPSCTGTGADTTGANVVTAVKTAASSSLHDLSKMTVTVSYPTDSRPGSLVTVQINVTYVPYVPFPGLAHPLSSSAQGRIVY